MKVDNIKQLLSYYFTENTNNPPFIECETSAVKEEKIKNELENLLNRYINYIKIYHSSKILINSKGIFEKEPIIQMSYYLRNKEIINDPYTILSLYLSLNLYHYVKDHPRHKDVINYLTYNTNILQDFKNSSKLMQEYTSTNKQLEFINSCIILVNKYIILNRFLDKSILDKLCYSDFTPITCLYCNSKKEQFVHILKQFNFISK